MDLMMKHWLVRLFSLKGIITLMLTGVFCYQAIAGEIHGQDFLTIFSVVIAFYFGTQSRGEPSKPALGDPPIKGGGLSPLDTTQP